MRAARFIVAGLRPGVVEQFEFGFAADGGFGGVLGDAGDVGINLDAGKSAERGARRKRRRDYQLR